MTLPRPNDEAEAGAGLPAQGDVEVGLPPSRSDAEVGAGLAPGRSDAEASSERRRRLHRRLTIYMVVFALALGAILYRRHWSPDRVVETAHYRIESTASEAETREVGAVIESLHAAFTARFAALPGLRAPSGKLQARLYADRDEFRRCNPNAGWAEAFYRHPVCHQYYARGQSNTTHWGVHEATHQLAYEVANLRLPRWLSEGLATYCGSSRLEGGVLHLGRLDANTYPIWWLSSLTLSGDRAADAAAGDFIPLATLIAGEGGPSVDEHFNLYYVHWWSLAHFLFHGDDGAHADGALRLLAANGAREAFEEHIGPLEQIEPAWYDYLRGFVANGERYRAALALPVAKTR